MANVIIKPSDQAAPKGATANQVVGWSSGQMHDPNDGLRFAPLAKHTLGLLMKHYPGWAWFVEVNGGMLIIRNYDLDMSGKWCMARKLDVLQESGGTQEREIVRLAGEFLERANQRRGAPKSGDQVKKLDGANKVWHRPFGVKA
jgi:hypothetical protein